MAAWSDEFDVLEDFGQSVRVSDDYDWDGSLEGGSGSGSAAPAPSEILSLADRIQVSLDEGDRIIVAIDETFTADARADREIRDALAKCLSILDAA